MRFSFNWLKDYVKTGLTASRVAADLNLSSFELEGIENLGQGLEQVVAGKILTKEKHPNADLLSVCTIDVGLKQPIQVVCGNSYFEIKVGDILPLVKAPATLPGGVEIVKREVRGVLSEGMLCSDKEMQVELTQEGLYRFAPGTKPGTRLIDAAGLNDTVLELNVLPNRPDCMGYIGMAREVAALTGASLVLPKVRVREGGVSVKTRVSVDVKDTELCPRYMARVIRDVKMGPSPLWLQQRLLAAGLRPINNVVDVTNFVMLETTQPLHAFDYDKLAGTGKKEIAVRLAKKGEKLLTLDGQKRVLNDKMLVIADSEKPVALAGVMGGKKSEVDNSTKNIVLEAAVFNRVPLRRAARQLGIRTDAFARFERGVSVALVGEALNRAAALITEIAGGEALVGSIDTGAMQKEPRQLALNLDRVQSFLGIKAEPLRVVEMLKRLDFKITGTGPIRKVTVPDFRLDVTCEEDLLEEVARLWGFDKLPATLPVGRFVPGDMNKGFVYTERVADYLVDNGFFEIVSVPMVGRDTFEKFGLESAGRVEIVNPLSGEYQYFRTELFPGVVEGLVKGQKRVPLCMFETGTVMEFKKGSLPKETTKLSLAVMGGIGLTKLNKRAEQFFAAKGYVDCILRLFGLKAEYAPIVKPGFHAGRTAKLLVGEVEVGFIGQLDMLTAKKIGLEKPAVVAELSLDALVKMAQTQVKFKAVSNFPTSEFDYSAAFGKGTVYSELEAKLREAVGDYLVCMYLFDVYEEQGAATKSLAVHFEIGAMDHTLTDAEIKKVRVDIEKVIKNSGGEIKGGKVE